MRGAGAATASTHLRVLAAEARPAGGAAEARARDYSARLLAAHGFSVTEEPFSYSTLPGRAATPAAGMASIVALVLAAAAGARGSGGGALATLVAVSLLVAALSLWMVRHGVLALDAWRAQGVNLVATRGTPRIWLVAHLDSKSQPVPIVVRALGIIATIAVWLVAYAAALAQLGGAPLASVWPWMAGAGAVAGIPMVLSVVGARSAGALDNASGVASVLGAATGLSPSIPLGIVLTSAEELGLAGARAWVRGRLPARAINFDGVDDAGTLRFTWTGRRPVRLLAVLHDAASRLGVPAATARLVPGVLVDGVALADAGWEVVTVSRGGWRSVARVHTPGDDLKSLAGDGVELAARVTVALVSSLSETEEWR